MICVRIGNQGLRVAPERAQTQIELAFDAGEQGAATLVGEHGAAVGERQLEIVFLLLRVVAIVADAIVDPAFQPGNRQLIHQLRRLAEERGQTGAGNGCLAAVDGASGAHHQLTRDVEIAGELLARAETARDGGQRLHQGGNGVAVGGGLQGADKRHDVLQRRRAGGSGRCWPGLEKGQHRLRSAAEPAQGFGRRHKVVHFLLREGVQRLVQAFFKDIGHLGEAAVHLAPPGLHLGMKHVALACVRRIVHDAVSWRTVCVAT